MLETVERLITRFPGARDWPCCVFVSRLIAAHAGLDDLFGPHNRGWWSRANIWIDKEEYSNIEAYAEVVQRVIGGTVPYTIFVENAGIPWGRWRGALEPDKWYAVQGWRHDGGLGGRYQQGHTFVFQTTDRIDTGRVLESSVRRRLRYNGKQWGDPQVPDTIDLKARLLRWQAGAGLLELW